MHGSNTDGERTTEETQGHTTYHTSIVLCSKIAWIIVSMVGWLIGV